MSDRKSCVKTFCGAKMANVTSTAALRIGACWLEAAYPVSDRILGRARPAFSHDFMRFIGFICKFSLFNLFCGTVERFFSEDGPCGKQGLSPKLHYATAKVNNGLVIF